MRSFLLSLFPPMKRLKTIILKEPGYIIIVNENTNQGPIIFSKPSFNLYLKLTSHQDFQIGVKSNVTSMVFLRVWICDTSAL